MVYLERFHTISPCRTHEEFSFALPDQTYDLLKAESERSKSN